MVTARPQRLVGRIGRFSHCLMEQVLSNDRGCTAGLEGLCLPCGVCIFVARPEVPGLSPLWLLVEDSSSPRYLPSHPNFIMKRKTVNSSTPMPRIWT